MAAQIQVGPTWRLRGAVAGPLLVAAGLGIAAAAVGPWRSAATAAIQAPTPTIDPRLLIVPQTTTVQARLTADMRLSGTLSPTIPGPNALSLTIRDRAGHLVRGGRLHLVATMPGMDTGMVPSRAVLAPHGDRYSGQLSLPMFGRYRATVAIAAPGGPYTGTLTIGVFPPGFSAGR